MVDHDVEVPATLLADPVPVRVRLPGSAAASERAELDFVEIEYPRAFEARDFHWLAMPLKRPGQPRLSILGREQFQDAVGNTKHENILYRFFAEIMVNAVDLRFVKDRVQAVIQLHRRLEIASKGLFENDAGIARTVIEFRRAEQLDRPGVVTEQTFDGRADIYALGCVAFWLLTGRPPFEGADAMSILLHHAQTPPSAPSGMSEEPIPPQLDAIVLECLAKDPLRRPASADVLWERLDRVPLAREWNQRRARTWWEMHEPELVRRRAKQIVADAGAPLGDPKDMPAAVTWLLSLSNFIKTWWWLLLIFLILAIVAVHVLFQDKARLAAMGRLSGSAIQVLDAPANDTTWAAEDARYSTVRWMANMSSTYAIGPSDFDPRTGEIILRAPFAAAWVDTSARGSALGRGIVTAAGTAAGTGAAWGDAGGWASTPPEPAATTSVAIRTCRARAARKSSRQRMARIPPGEWFEIAIGSGMIVHSTLRRNVARIGRRYTRRVCSLNVRCCLTPGHSCLTML